MGYLGWVHDSTTEELFLQVDFDLIPGSRNTSLFFFFIYSFQTTDQRVKSCSQTKMWWSQTGDYLLSSKRAWNGTVILGGVNISRKVKKKTKQKKNKKKKNRQLEKLNIVIFNKYDKQTEQVIEKKC